jgi:hypothetical protein
MTPLRTPTPLAVLVMLLFLPSRVMDAWHNQSGNVVRLMVWQQSPNPRFLALGKPVDSALKELLDAESP